MGTAVGRMNLAEFLAWEGAQPERFELHRGDVFDLAAASARQNRVILNLVSGIDKHLAGTACQVFAQGMKVLTDESILYPDLLVTCGKAEAGDEQLIHDPKLIIEVLTPKGKGYDQRRKFDLYRSLASLRQFVLIDPADRRIEVFTLAETGEWTLADQTASGTLMLHSIGLEMPQDSVFKGVAAAPSGSA